MNSENILQKKSIYYENLAVNSAAVIPALNPIPILVSLVNELILQGIPQVIVVNDGSDPSYDYIFDQLKNIKGCSLLIHDVNFGKGRALKTAFNYYLEHFSYLDGVVTADADGQHAVEDIINVGRQLTADNSSIVLGMRDFSDKSVPKRSFMGNRVTSTIFRLFYGNYLEDTQTGLRGIPTSDLYWLANMQGDRYEYEINMLINAKRRNVPITSIPIRTLYFDNNSGTHFNTFRDAGRIFMCLVSGLLIYSFSSLVSGILDICTFFIFNSLLLTFLDVARRLLSSTVIARITSSLLNFYLNRKVFSAESEKLPGLLIRYYTLWFIQLLSSYGLVYAASIIFSSHDTINKLVIDMILGIFSYQVQLRWVYRNKDIGMEVY
jgi:Glycosyltransferases involved in cell wall biogenesis